MGILRAVCQLWGAWPHSAAGLRLPERNNHPALPRCHRSTTGGGLVVSADLIRSIVICRHHIDDYDLPFLLGMLNGRQPTVYTDRSDDEYLRLF